MAHKKSCQMLSELKQDCAKHALQHSLHLPAPPVQRQQGGPADEQILHELVAKNCDACGHLWHWSGCRSSKGSQPLTTAGLHGNCSQMLAGTQRVDSFGLCAGDHVHRIVSAELSPHTGTSM